MKSYFVIPGRASRFLGCGEVAELMAVKDDFLSDGIWSAQFVLRIEQSIEL
jgi:hypothetical protein